MKKEKEILFLKNTPFFQKLSWPILSEISEHLSEKRYPAGTNIYSEGDASDKVYLIKEGLVVAIKANSMRNLVVGIFIPSNVFGITGGYEKDPQLFTAKAEKDTVLYILPREKCIQWMKKHPEMTQSLIKHMAGQLSALYEHMEINFGTVEMRLIHLILFLSINFGMEIPLTKTQMALMTNTTLETCVRNLKPLEKDGLIKTSRGNLKITNFKNLVAQLNMI